MQTRESEPYTSVGLALKYPGTGFFSFCEQIQHVFFLSYLSTLGVFKSKNSFYTLFLFIIEFELSKWSWNIINPLTYFSLLISVLIFFLSTSVCSTKEKHFPNYFPSGIHNIFHGKISIMKKAMNAFEGFWYEFSEFKIISPAGYNPYRTNLGNSSVLRKSWMNAVSVNIHPNIISVRCVVTL